MGKVIYIAYIMFYLIVSSLFSIFLFTSGILSSEESPDTLISGTNGTLNGEQIVNEVGNLATNKTRLPIPNEILFLWGLMSVFAIVSVFMVIYPFG